MGEEVECVIDGCDYSAESVRSVEGHISGMADDGHVGNGRMYREELVAQKEEALNSGPEEGGEAGEEAPEAAEKEESGSGGVEGEMASASAVAPAAAGVGLLGSFRGGSGGSKLPLILGALLVGLLLVSVFSGGSSSSTAGATQEPAASTPTEAAEETGGLQ